MRRLARTGALGSAAVSWLLEPDAPDFSHHPSRAAALLDEAGSREPDGAGPQPRLRLAVDPDVDRQIDRATRSTALPAFTAR